ncbi:Sodium- and chloride-dependent glycine transporter 2 [Araneus ventricosus]|uniref:Transporter n=1 Tax=Araneus ventricosus TaxID=182803 RepID=A0A4Y2QS77_ARAVE|nr:Sodium- and chloride-dependent glycine transporter 2 [Araneus ventricosus]
MEESTHQTCPNPRITTLLPHPDHSRTRNEKWEKQRPTWSKQIEFVLSSVGYAVGLGNIWRFPYVCYKNGGGAFLIPYVFFLTLCGLPMIFMETSLGQFGSLGSISIWKISPLFKGMGFGMAILSLVTCIYYNVILAWSLYYLYHSYFVLWSTCGNSWNTLNCVASDAFTQSANISAANLTGKIITQLDIFNSTPPENLWEKSLNTSKMASSEEFWLNCLMAEYRLRGRRVTDCWKICWIVPCPSNRFGYCNGIRYGDMERHSVYTELIHANLCRMKLWHSGLEEVSSSSSDHGSKLRVQSRNSPSHRGAPRIHGYEKSLDKEAGSRFPGGAWVPPSVIVVYVTATLPYFVLICLLIRGLTLPGSWDGIGFFLTPKWEKLLSFRVWGDAAGQIFYSSGVAWGCILTMASHNRFTNNIYRDSMVIACINYGTSILAGFVVFSLLGFMAYETGKTIEDVVSEGPGLAFVVYPEAISRLPVPSVWAFLFFFMLLAVGLDTVFGEVETTISALVDEYPKLLRKRKTLFTAMVCGALFLLGLPCVTQGGIYVVQLMDWYCAVFSLMFFSLFETIVVAWIYGADRFALDICLMTKRMPSLWWKLCWCYITPTIITALLIFIFVNHTAITYDDYIYPDWSIVIGWILAMCSIAPVPLFAVWKLLRGKGNLKQRLINSLRPTPDWGPALEEHKILYRKSLNIKNSRLEQKPQEKRPVSLDTFSEAVNR